MSKRSLLPAVIRRWFRWRRRSLTVATVSMVCRCDGYVVYPDMIKVHCAKDNGEILGVEAITYLTFHRPNVISAPRLSEAEVCGLSPNLKVDEIRQAVVMDEFKEKPAGRCWGGQTATLPIFRGNGEEEKIQRIDENGLRLSKALLQATLF